ERLLDAAWELVDGEGAVTLTLGEVATRAGVSRQALYLHFPNRATLLAEMARRMDRISGFRRRLAATRRLPAAEGFRALVEEWLAYVPRILRTARALEAATVTGSDGAEAYLDRMAEWRAAIRIAVERLAEEGRLAPGWTVDEAADWAWAQLHPSLYHHLVHERGWPPEAVARRIIGALERDLLNPAG
ncbi:MAG TPA: TetR/AcrR family transcriptional regulator, partial [Geodermatophilus sp.]|nr:TetR/AcrR family transcriptional regulator [Geodermatophilus sp.]